MSGLDSSTLFSAASQAACGTGVWTERRVSSSNGGTPNDSEIIDLESARIEYLPQQQANTRRRRSWRSSSSFRIGRIMHLFNLRSPQRTHRAIIWVPPFLLGGLFLIGLLFVDPVKLRFQLYTHHRLLAPVIEEEGGVYPFSHLRNLVMVAGHSVYISKNCQDVGDDNAWYLEPYQLVNGQAGTFVAHVRLGVETAAGDPKALLLFSGGETRLSAGPRSEATSYWLVAEAKNWFGFSDTVRSRTLTEEHARDSFENLLFSICRFKELTGHYPHNITAVSYDFKRRRFSSLHRSAISFPTHRFSFVGSPALEEISKHSEQGEERTLELFRSDPYGCEGFLRKKRLDRDPFLRTIPYPNRCPELRELFMHCGPGYFSQRLPWDTWGGLTDAES